MVDREFRFDPDVFLRHGARLADLGDRIGLTYIGLRDDLTQVEGCWGDDDLGRAFAESFDPHAAQLLTNLSAMEESLRRTADGIVDAARAVEAEDQNSAVRITGAASAPIGPNPGHAAGTPQSARGVSASTPDPVVSADPASVLGPSQSAAVDPGSSAKTPLAGPTGRSARAEQPRPETAAGIPEENGGPGDNAWDGQSASPGLPPTGSGPPAPASRPGGGSERPSPPISTVSSTAAERPRAVRGQDALPSGDPRRAVSAGRPGTPWTRAPLIASGGSAADASGPASGAPPQSPRPGEPRPRERDRERFAAPPAGRPGMSAVLGWLARTLAERHGVQVVGFDLPGLDETAVRQFAAAVDRVLTDYPAIVLDVVGVADLGDDAPVVRWAGELPAAAISTVRSIMLDQRVAREPGRVADLYAADPLVTGDPVIYVATVRELGLAFDAAGGGVVRKNAQRLLIAAYLRVVTGQHTTLGEVVRGYRCWRAELIGSAGYTAGFDPGRAVSTAFAEVVLRGPEACAPARILHTALVGAVSERE